MFPKPNPDFPDNPDFNPGSYHCIPNPHAFDPFGNPNPNDIFTKSNKCKFHQTWDNDFDHIIAGKIGECKICHNKGAANCMVNGICHRCSLSNQLP